MTIYFFDGLLPEKSTYVTRGGGILTLAAGLALTMTSLARRRASCALSPKLLRERGVVSGLLANRSLAHLH